MQSGGEVMEYNWDETENLDDVETEENEDCTLLTALSSGIGVTLNAC